MSAFPTRSYLYALGLVTLTVAGLTVATAVGPLPSTRQEAFVAALLVAMMVCTEVLDVRIPHPVTTFAVSVTAALALASGLALGPAAGATVVMVVFLLDGLYARRQPMKTLVNVANTGLSTLAASATYAWLTPNGSSPLDTPTNMAALFVAGLVFTLINSWSLALVVAPVVGTTARRLWRSNVRGTVVEMVAVPALGGLAPVLADEHPLAMLILIIPVLGPHFSFKSWERAQAETRLAMERLADALERRDPYTHSHSLRVASYVDGILGEIPHIPFETAETIRAAARIHDLGKLAIKDASLTKSGPLTLEERREIEQHAEIGADVVSRLEGYRQAVPMVRHHHERWDGRGYPAALRGNEIPLGARIIAVADTFDAMTSDRPYRTAVPLADALDEVRRQSGRQFDPMVVAAFERFAIACFGPAVRADASTERGAAERLTPEVAVSAPVPIGTAARPAAPIAAAANGAGPATDAGFGAPS